MSTLVSNQSKAIRIVTLTFYFSFLLLANCKKIEGELEIKVLTGTVIRTGSDYCIIRGEVIDLGGTMLDQHGFCYGESENPTIADTRSRLGNKNSTGQFTDSITGLNSNTTYYVRAYGTNETGTGYGEQVTFNTAGSKPSVTTASISNITRTSAQGGGIVTDDGGGEVTAKGICWSISPDPTIADNHTNDGTGTGGFTSVMNGLSCGNDYYVRAYATNSTGTAYGSQETFSTGTCVYTAPVVITSPVSAITDVSATSGGNVTSDGGDANTVSGVCWSTWHTPTTDHDHTSDGTGEGEFSSSLTGLEPSTTYYVRAYATNIEATSYGDTVSFTTLDEVVTDVDGNIYAVVKFGSQTWMAENLRTTKYNDGNPIAYATDNNRYIENYCWYNHDDSYAEIYGALYNAYIACSDSLCPVGWHIPDQGEWQTLNGYLSLFYGEGGSGYGVAKAMASTSGWDSYATEGTVGYDQAANNASGFNAQPAGLLFGGSGFTFKDMGRRTLWYTKGTLPIDYYTQVYLELGNYSSGFNTNGSSGYCEITPCYWPSFSIRCIKD